MGFLPAVILNLELQCCYLLFWSTLLTDWDENTHKKSAEQKAFRANLFLNVFSLGVTAAVGQKAGKYSWWRKRADPTGPGAKIYSCQVEGFSLNNITNSHVSPERKGVSEESNITKSGWMEGWRRRERWSLNSAWLTICRRKAMELSLGNFCSITPTVRALCPRKCDGKWGKETTLKKKDRTDDIMATARIIIILHVMCTSEAKAQCQCWETCLSLHYYENATL